MGTVCLHQEGGEQVIVANKPKSLSSTVKNKGSCL